MSVRTDTINLTVNINGDKSRAELNNLKKTAADLTLQLTGMKKGTAEYIATSNDLKKVNQDMAILKQQIGITALTQKELIQELSKLKSLKGSVTPFSKEFEDLSSKIKTVENRLYEVRTGSQGFNAEMSKITDSVRQFSIIALGGMGLIFLVNQIKNVISIGASLSTQLADIMRVTGMTKAEVLALNKSLNELDTGTSTKGLRDIAIVAGKLGVAKEDILGFVKATDMLVVALGDELGDADQITTQLGKIINVFDKGDGKVTGEKLTAIGNAIVDLANKGVATGGFIVDFTQRLAGLAKTANIGLGETMGLAAGLEELGQRSEASSTAVIKVIGNIGKDVPKFAKVAGLSVEEFSKILREKPVEALIRVSEGLVKGKNSFEEISKSFDMAGEDGARIITVLGAIGGKADFFREKINDATGALKESSQITQAFELKNQTLASTLDKIGKEFIKFASGGGVNDFLKSIADRILSLVKFFGSLTEFVAQNTTAIILLAAGVLLLNGNYIKLAATLVKDSALKLYNAVVTRATALANTIAIASQSAYITVISLFTGRITLATAAQRLWNIAVSAGLGPIGLLITAVGVLIIALNNQSAAAKMANDISNKVSEATSEQMSKIGILSGVIQDGNVSLDNKKKALQALINLNPQYLSGLTLENMKTSEGKKILDGYINSLVQKAELEAKQALLIEKLKSRNEAFNAIRNQDKQPEFKNASDEELTRQLMNPKGGVEFGRFQQAMSFAGVNDIAGLKNSIKDIQTLQSQIGDVVKKNVDILGGSGSGGGAGRAGGIIENLKRKIEELEKELPGLTTKQAIHANREQVKKYQAELNALLENSSTQALDNAKERYRKEYDDLMSKLSVDIAKANMHPLEAAYVKINEETAKQIDKIKEGLSKKFISPAEAQKAFDKIREHAVAASLEAYEKYKKEVSDKRKDAQNDIVFQPPLFNEAAFKKEMEKTLQKSTNIMQRVINAFKRDRAAEIELKIITSPEGSKKWLENTKKLLTLQMDAELENTDLSESEQELIRKKYRQKRVQAEQKAIDREAEIWTSRINKARDVNSILSNIENARINKTIRAGELEKQRLQKQLNSKLLSQEQYNAKVSQIDEEADRKKRILQREQAKREKALNLMQAVVNGYAAVSKAATALPWPFNLPGIIEETIRSGLLVGSIISTPLPELGKGKWVRDGDKHSDPSGGINAKIERDEAVMNAASMTDNTEYEVRGTTAQITSALNSKKGGASWAGGAIIKQVDWLKNRPASINPNMPRIMEQGGVVRPMNPPAAAPSSAPPGQDISQLTAEVKGLREDVKSWNTKLHAIVSIKEYREEEKKYDAAVKASGFKQS